MQRRITGFDIHDGLSGAGESALRSGRFTGRSTLRGNHLQLRTSRIPEVPTRPPGEFAENFVIKTKNIGSEKAETLEDLCIAQNFHANLKRDAKIEKLRGVQQFMIPFILNPDYTTDLLVVGPTACGKTFGVLIGVLQHVINLSVHQLQPKDRLPKVIIVTASQEAAIHVYNLCINWTDKTDVIICSAIAGSSSGQESQRYSSYGADLIVSTLGRLCDWINDGTVNLSDVDYLVFDDASSMMTVIDFDLRWWSLIDQIPSKCRLITVTSTWSDEFQFHVRPHDRENYAEIRVQVDQQKITNFTFNKTIEQHFMSVRFVDVIDICIKIIAKNTLKSDIPGTKSRPPKTVVFTSDNGHATLVAESLRMYDRFNSDKVHFHMNVGCIHKGMVPGARQALIASFQKNLEIVDSTDVLIATDALAAGIVASVDLVINLDFPVDLVSFVRRVGRVGRDGYRGKAFTMVDINEFNLWNTKRRRALVEVINALVYVPRCTYPVEFDELAMTVNPWGY